MRAVEALPARGVVPPFAERDEDRRAGIGQRVGGVVEMELFHFTFLLHFKSVYGILRRHWQQQHRK